MSIDSTQTVGKFPPRQTEYFSRLITPDDANDLLPGPNDQFCRGIRCTGAGGDVSVNLTTGGTAVLTGVVLNAVVLVDINRIKATATTATGIEALY